MNRALIITIFFMMYWPTKVSEKGAAVKEIAGKRNRGVKVQII